MSDGDTPSFALRFFMGIAFAAAGLFPILAAFDVGPFHASSINGPPWIGVAVGFAVFTSARWVAGLECRIAFGIGATMCDGLVLMVAARGLTQAGVANALPAMLDKTGTALILLAFAPILLVWLVAKLTLEGARWCWSRITGRALAQK